MGNWFVSPTTLVSRGVKFKPTLVCVVLSGAIVRTDEIPDARRGMRSLLHVNVALLVAHVNAVRRGGKACFDTTAEQPCRTFELFRDTASRRVNSGEKYTRVAKLDVLVYHRSRKTECF